MLHFVEIGLAPPIGTPFRILIAADTHREAMAFGRKFRNLVKHRGDVEVFPVGLGVSVGGLRVDLIINCITVEACNRHLNEAEQWMKTLTMRIHPSNAVLDITGTMKALAGRDEW